MYHNKITGKSDKNIIAICSSIALIICILDSLIPVGVAVGVLYILVVLISLWAHSKRLPIYMAIASTLLIGIGFYLSPTGGELWKSISNRAFSLISIWMVTLLSIQRRTLYEEKEKALQEVKVLSGFLPICASCKKIRDDKGYWNQIESYIRDHSDAEFSHGICPNCAVKLYPDLDLDEDNKNT